MRNAFIHSTGMFVPDKVVPNSYFDELLGEPVSQWLVDNVQIFERRWCNKHETTSTLCVQAAKNAMERGNIEPKEIDLLIIATDTPEYISPSTASKVQHLLGLINAGSFDVNSACAGFVTALDIGSKYIRADENYNTVLVVGAYAMSKYLNMGDKKTVTLFADGAGAVVLKSGNDLSRGFLNSQLITKGEYEGYMGIYAGGTFQPTNNEVLKNKDNLLKFITKFPKELNPEMWSMMVSTLCRRLDILPTDVDHFFMTQINIHSIWETMERLGVDRNKATTIMHHYGYTGSACIPIALNEADKQGKIKPGDLLMFIGSGGGLAFASAVFRM